MMGCNVLAPQIFWVEKYRRNIMLTFFMSIFINIGMWFELIFTRVAPVVAIAEVKSILKTSGSQYTGLSNRKHIDYDEAAKEADHAHAHDDHGHH